jgi:hypothetical protein
LKREEERGQMSPGKTTTYPEDWVTTGWSKGPDHKWIELGHSAAVHASGPEVPPELTVHEVADKLNELTDRGQSMYWQYQKLAAEVRDSKSKASA